jgi:hypothetical protein
MKTPLDFDDGATTEQVSTEAAMLKPFEKDEQTTLQRPEAPVASVLPGLQYSTTTG